MNNCTFISTCKIHISVDDGRVYLVPLVKSSIEMIIVSVSSSSGSAGVQTVVIMWSHICYRSRVDTFEEEVSDDQLDYDREIPDCRVPKLPEELPQYGVAPLEAP